MIDLDKVKTIVLLMFENRSFDHMLGHLSYDRIKPTVDGIITPLSKYKNIYKGDNYIPFKIPADNTLQFDLPHEFDSIAEQLAKNKVSGKYAMSGFVKSYAEVTQTNPNPQCEPMGFFGKEQVPITSFLAQNFCVCDNWFSPLPSSTQPNRNMAFMGDSRIHSTHAGLIKIDNNIFDWMDQSNIRWKVYHDGLSFFALYPSLWSHVLGSNFKDYEYFHNDMINEPVGSSPEVIIVEPSYQDAPHIGSDRPNDNHAPLAIGWGEEFLRRTYQSVIANKEKWESTVFIVYYDEHGGFYDHVPPPKIKYITIGDTPYTFESLGPRIPGIIISPFVESGSVCKSLFDHTSVLQFLAQKFTPNTPFSYPVNVRKEEGIESISAALNTEIMREALNPPAEEIKVSTVLGKTLLSAPAGDTMAQSFENAANELIVQEQDKVQEKYPELLLWKDAVEQARS